MRESRANAAHNYLNSCSEVAVECVECPKALFNSKKINLVYTVSKLFVLFLHALCPKPQSQ
jgi:hypothetical protein